MDKEIKEWLTREEAASWLRVSVRTLNRYRREGLITAAVGPFGYDSEGREVDDPDLPMNAVRYHRDEVTRFAADESTRVVSGDG